MKLYEISTQLEAFLAAVDAGEIPDEAIQDTLDGLNGVLEDKMDDCASAYKGLIAEANEIKTEIDTLKARMDAKKRQAESLKSYISRCMVQAAGGEKPAKIETARNVLSYRKYTALDIEDESQLLAYLQSVDGDDSLLTYTAPKLDKKAITQAVKDGRELPGCQMASKLSLSIK